MQFLSPQWIEALDAAASTRGLESEGRLVIQQVVTGRPNSDVRYYVTVEGGAAAVRIGEADDPTVTFTQDYATAAEIAQGRVAAQEAFMAGRVRVGGDLLALVRHLDVLEELDRSFRAVRGQTEF